MFSVAVQPFGPFRKIVVNHNSVLSMEILPDFGAALNALVIPVGEKGSQNIIDGYLYSQQIPDSNDFKGVLLFPFPNRLRDGKWNHNSQDLQFDLNEPDRNHALHGILFDQKFEIVETNTSVEMAFIHLRYVSNGSHKAYPFTYQVDVEYVLTDSDGLTVNTSITNLGEDEMPFGLGWHPYFKTGSKVDNLNLEFSSVYSVEVDERLIPTGQQKVYTKFEGGKKLEDEIFDTCFFVGQTGRHKTNLIDTNQKIKFTIWQDSDSDSYQYLQIYTSPERQSIAIEPVSCLANALQNLDSNGLTILEPGNTHNMVWGIRF